MSPVLRSNQLAWHLCCPCPNVGLESMDTVHTAEGGKSETNSKGGKGKEANAARRLFGTFPFLNFRFVSDFGFRVSDLVVAMRGVCLGAGGCDSDPVAADVRRRIS